MIIGITTTLNEADGFQRVNVEYINRVAATGAVPILLTPIAGGAEANREHARHVIELVDGLLITGGGDVHPRYYVPDPAKNRDALGLDDLAAMGCGSSSHCRSTGAKVPFCGHYVPDRTFEEAMDGTSAVETVESLDGRDVLSATGRPPIPCLDGLLAVCEDRDGFELELARLAHERSLPTLSICRGMQVMNIVKGGGIYQDIGVQAGTTLKHIQQAPRSYGTHSIFVEDNTLLTDLWENKRTVVNSLHHQSCSTLGEGFIVSARSADGLIEAIEHKDNRFAVGVQWHPEAMKTEEMGLLFSAFLRAAAEYQQARG